MGGVGLLSLGNAQMDMPYLSTRRVDNRKPGMVPQSPFLLTRSTLGTHFFWKGRFLHLLFVVGGFVIFTFGFSCFGW